MRMLVIDDEREFVSILQQWFSKRGHTVHGVIDIRTLPDVLARNQYDVISLDLNMPNSPGLTWIERIHSMSPKTPIIVMTAQADPNLAKLALQSGADDFVCKPVSLPKLEQIMDTTRANRRRQAQLTSSTVCRGPCLRLELQCTNG